MISVLKCSLPPYLIFPDPCPRVLLSPPPSLTGGPGQPRWYTRPRGEKATRAVETFNLKFGNDVLHIYRYRIAEKFPRNIWMKYPKSIWSATAVRLGFLLFLQKLRYQCLEAHQALDPSMGIRLRTCFVTLLTPGRVVPSPRGLISVSPLPPESEHQDTTYNTLKNKHPPTLPENTLNIRK